MAIFNLITGFDLIRQTGVLTLSIYTWYITTSVMRVELMPSLLASSIAGRNVYYHFLE